MRKRTVFKWCDNHKGLGGGYNAAKLACEGGPARDLAKPCSPNQCVILPGTDYYSPTVTDGEFRNLVADWAVNRVSTTYQG